MDILGQQSCYHHHHREAVVRCPECQRYFCRECVTEHEDRMLCSQCLTQLTRSAQATGGRWTRHGALLVQGLIGFMGLWCIFYLLGRILLAIPYEFHEGAIWGSRWWNWP